MGILDELYGQGAGQLDGLEYRNGRDGLEAGRAPGGIQGLLGDISGGSDQVLAAIEQAKIKAMAAGGRQSPLGWLLGEIMASAVPSTVGSAARVAKAPMDYMQGRENDLRASDALLALPAVGAAGRTAAPALKVSPEVGGILGAGAGGFGYGYGVASDANAAGDRATLPTQRSRAEFEQTYNVPRPVAPSIEDVVAKARKDYEDSAAYKDLIRQSKASVASKKAQEVADAARAGFGATQAASSRAAADWEAAREKAWAAEQGDYENRLKAFQNQGFWDRNPEVKPYAMGAAYALPAIFGAGSAVQKGRTQQRLVDDILGSDVARATAAKGAADKMLNPSVMDQAKKVGATALAAGGPFEVRSIGDAADATFAPEGSGAQTRARAHFADPGKYFMEGLPQLVSGAILYGTGAKAGSLATRDSKAMLAGAAGMDEKAINEAATKKLAAINQQGVVDAAQREASIAGIKGRGQAAIAEGDAALAEKAAAEARSRISAPGGGILSDQPAPQPVVAPRPQPPPAPVQNQQPALPALAPQPREWAQLSPVARSIVEQHIASGAPLSSLTAEKLMTAINAQIGPGMPKATLSTTRGYLANLKKDVGGTPDRKQLQSQWSANPNRFALPLAAGAGGAGLLDWGD